MRRAHTGGGDDPREEGGAVAVKVAKESHDMRFDIPCIGPRTLETCARNGVAALALAEAMMRGDALAADMPLSRRD